MLDSTESTTASEPEAPTQAEPAPTTEPTAAVDAPPAKARARWVIPAAALALGLVVGAGAGAAIASTDPTESKEYQALERRMADQAEEAQGRISALSDRAREAQNAASEAQDAAAQRAAELDERERAVKTREDAVTATEERIAATSIGTGIWTVGVDVEPGTYRTSEAITGYCYWAIYKSGTSGADIIENDGPEGGFPTVTLSAGQDFENSDCGTFVKQ
jgi:hypothetical protein